MFEFNDTQKMIEQTFRQYCEKEIAPHVDSMENGEMLPFDLMRKMADTFGLRELLKARIEKRMEKRRKAQTPEKETKDQETMVSGELGGDSFGGAGMDPMIGVIFAKEISRISPSLCLSIGASLGLCGGTIIAKGTPEQITRFGVPVLTMEKIGCWGLTEPEAGSDAFSLKTTARPDGDYYVLNGSKTFITNAPYADVFVIWAKIDRDKEARSDKRLVFPFVIEKGTDGLAAGKPMQKMGMRGSPTGEIFLDDCRIPKNQLLGEKEEASREQAQETLAGERSGAPAMCWGIIERCLDDCLKYATTRKQFGKHIGSFQLIQGKLAKMFITLENVKNITFKQAWMQQAGKGSLKEACAAKYYCTTAAVEVGLEAIQLMGGYGYMREYHVERLMRDAKLLDIGGGTNEIQLLNIAKSLLREHGLNVSIY